MQSKGSIEKQRSKPEQSNGRKKKKKRIKRKE